MNQLQNKHWIAICRQSEGEEDRSKPEKGPFWRKQEMLQNMEWGQEFGGKRRHVEMLHRGPLLLIERKDTLLLHY